MSNGKQPLLRKCPKYERNESPHFKARCRAETTSPTARKLLMLSSPNRVPGSSRLKLPFPRRKWTTCAQLGLNPPRQLSGIPRKKKGPQEKLLKRKQRSPSI